MQQARKLRAIKTPQNSKVGEGFYTHTYMYMYLHKIKHNHMKLLIFICSSYRAFLSHCLISRNVEKQ